MLVKYFDDEFICETFAKYHAEDKVQLLVPILTEDGVVEKGTKAIILRVKLLPNVYYPDDVPRNEVYDYEITGESWVFKYNLRTEDNYEFWITSKSFELPTQINENTYSQKEKERKQEMWATLRYNKFGILLYMLSSGLITEGVGSIFHLMASMSAVMRGTPFNEVVFGVHTLIYGIVGVLLGLIIFFCRCNENKYSFGALHKKQRVSPKINLKKNL